MTLSILIVVLVFNVPPTAKVIWRRGHGFKSHPTDWRSRESSLRPLVYKASGLSTTPQRLLISIVMILTHSFTGGVRNSYIPILGTSDILLPWCNPTWL